MSPSVCVTVDVEDFYDGMEVLGEHVERPAGPGPGTARGRGLRSLLERLESQSTETALTLFVVGDYACKVKSELEEFIERGHEVASHGPDHGRLPAKDVVSWLSRGRAELEEMLQTPVRGFRSPRFDVPGDGDLERYRDQLAEAGFGYVSDTHRLGAASAVSELPVLTWRGLKVGGGSYQRVLPARALKVVVERSSGPAVLYYHSYDFDGTLPGLSAIRSVALARQLAGRRRIESVFSYATGSFGSETCSRVVSRARED